MHTHQIIATVSVEDFVQITKGKVITLSAHATERLDLGDRRFLSVQELRTIMRSQPPRGVGLQRNGHYAVFYGQKSGYLRVIVQVYPQEIEIITFLSAESMPHLTRFPHEQ